MDKAAGFEIRMDRYESKYVIPVSLVPAIRRFIQTFCVPDPYTRGDPPEYVITTLQLDTADYALHRAKANEAYHRFKLRVRTYGVPGESAVYLEVKRKHGASIVKSRAKVPFEAWGEPLMRAVRHGLKFKSRTEEEGFLEFVRLVRETDARPTVLIRYTRESYFGRNDPYARVTFDRNLLYQPVTSWNSWGRGGQWRSMDTPYSQNKDLPFSGVILEIKTLSDSPHWMIDLVERFELVRGGNCKYSSAIWQESLFDQMTLAPYTGEDLLYP